MLTTIKPRLAEMHVNLSFLSATAAALSTPMLSLFPPFGSAHKVLWMVSCTIWTFSSLFTVLYFVFLLCVLALFTILADRIQVCIAQL